MTETTKEISLFLEAPDDIAADLSRQLRRELLEINEVQKADFAPGPPPPDHAKGVGLDWNTIILTVLASSGVATTAIGAVVTLTQEWLKRHKEDNLTVVFSNGRKLTANLTPDERKRVIDALLADAQGQIARKPEVNDGRDLSNDLYEVLNSAAFTLEDIEDLSFKLGIDWEDLKGDTKGQKSRALIIFLRARNRLPELVEAIHKERPGLLTL